VLRFVRNGTESNRFAVESQNLWRDIFMASHHLFGYNDALDVIEIEEVSSPFLKRVY